MSTQFCNTNTLFPRVNFIIGLGSAIAIMGKYFEFNYSDDDDDADSKAIYNDWHAIGDDIRKVVNENKYKKLKTAV